ncbi:MAG: PadR family transcriptional regulator [Candidatus Omnitrophica bacterium]|nr:PadR family transcriptional regulator [Candidatus Omnitrophota bacterium]MBU1868907.1 PadR family transcriptional regulator [Candidatus Omnitrophota bacterium]
MIEQELLLLGLLRENPKHGYEIKKKIREILSLFAGVELKSIYYPLRVLEKKGLVLKHTGKKGRRPQRLIYALTPKGKRRFEELLSRSFLDFRRPQFSLDLSLYFLEYLKPELAHRRLRARQTILKKISKGLKQMITAKDKKMRASLIRILEHNQQQLEAESRFLANLTEII